MGLKSRDLYIDLGTANTLIYMSGRGFVLNQPSVLAVRRRGERTSLLNWGSSAKRMLGKTPAEIEVIRPLREGVISDFQATTQMLTAFIENIRNNHFWLRPRVLISLPCQVTHFEKKAVEEVAKALGAGIVHLLDEPMAAAIGAGIPVLSNRGHMVIDIGGGTTEIAVVSMGGIVVSEAVRIGCHHLDEWIAQHLRHQFDFVVGEQTAEKIKIEVAQLHGPERSIAIGGLDLRRGLPSRFQIRSSMIQDPIRHFYNEIRQAVLKILEQVPPEIAGDLAESGLLLAGGGALLSGLAESLQKDFGLPVQVARNPLLSVAEGGAKSLEDHRLFDALQRPA